MHYEHSKDFIPVAKAFLPDISDYCEQPTHNTLLSNLDFNAKCFVPLIGGTTDLSALNANALPFKPRHGQFHNSISSHQYEEMSSREQNQPKQNHGHSPIIPESLENGSEVSAGNTNNISDHTEMDVFSTLSTLREKHLNRVLLAHLNINSIRNKFDMLKDMVSGKVDILLISETKIDDSFPKTQFFIPGFASPYRLNRTANGGGLLLYIREDIPSKLLKTYNIPRDNESFFIEINLHNKKWLIGATYNPSKSKIGNHLNILSECIDHYLPYYDNVLIMGDFNSEISEELLHDFCEIYTLKNLVKEPTCFKSTEHPSCIDLLLTNKSRSFQDTTVIETGLS